MKHLAVAFAASLALSGCLLSQDQQPSCIRFPDCASCTEQTGCGWCPSGTSAGTCVHGSSRGPDRGACPDYRWTDCYFDPCAVHQNARDCVRASACEWCPARSACTLDASACAPFDECRANTTEAQCGEFSSCTWCIEERVCTSDPAECAAPNPCRATDRCRTCSDLGCGWCQDGLTGACFPNQAECTGTWIAPGSCPPPCSALTCDACLADAEGCEWAHPVLGDVRDPARCRFTEDVGMCQPSAG